MLVLCVGINATVHTYRSHSVLSSGHFVKVRVAESGLVKITYEELRDMGIDAAAVRVFGYGGAMLEQSFNERKIDDLPQVPIYMDKGSDGVFGKGDYILFYANGPVGWTYTGTRYKHTQNTYSQYGYYLISDNAGEQLLFDALHAEVDTVGTIKQTTYVSYQLHEKDLVNIIDRSKGADGAGREFYGEMFDSASPFILDFTFPHIVSSEPIYCYVELLSQPMTGYASQIKITAGRQSRELSIAAVAYNDHFTKGTISSRGFNYEASPSENQRVRIDYSADVDGAVAFMNYIELSATCELNLAGVDMLIVGNDKSLYEDKRSTYLISGANSQTQVWDITYRDSIRSIPTQLNEKSELWFTADNGSIERRFVVFNPSSASTISLYGYGRNGTTPLSEEVANQDLHRLTDIDMVILTTESMHEQADRLAQIHRETDGMTVAVVTQDEVFNEFSSGTPDATAYRWIMKMLRDRALASQGKQHEPQCLLLMGDGSFDNRKLLLTSAPNTLLTYQARNSIAEVEAYATDDYFGYLDDNDGLSDISNQMDIAVGRLPVNTAEEAQQMVDKIIRYIENTNYGNWRTKTCFLADDGNGVLHTKAANNMATVVEELQPSLEINKIFLDSYLQEVTAAGESYPLAKNKFDNLLNDGLIFFNYCGHASPDHITSERFLPVAEIVKMTNQNQGLWVLATCEFAKFDAATTSAAETAVLNPQGGAIAILASCRTVYATQNEELDRLVCKYMFTPDSITNQLPTIGQAVQRGKNAYAQNPIFRDKNRLPYILMGDPALKLHYPHPYKVVAISEGDTLRSLSVPTISGFIEDENGDTLRSFNGKIEMTVYDKQQLITTRDNDMASENRKNKITLTYTDYPNVVFNGEADVVDGKFSISFLVPKDIRYNFGQARILFYAYDSETGDEALGSAAQFVIGGNSDVTLTDTIGPQIQLYLNNAAFADGDQTHPTPRFYADLNDEHGINTVGNGIGHDLLLVVDNDLKQTYILNGYFKAQSGSYKEGRVSYLLSELSEGEHQLHFTAWDLMNNSSTATLRFVVKKNTDAKLYSVSAYPNPAREGENFNIRIEHDRPDAALTVELSIYDLAGKLMYRKEQMGTNDITVSSTEAHLHAGVYMYRVRIKTDDTDYTSKAGRIMIM